MTTLPNPSPELAPLIDLLDQHGEKAQSTAPRHRPPSIPFQPGIEGLRGLAVAAVLAFHNGFSWATGGFLGVSTFFTLSGFLITTLLLAEHEHKGWISLGSFWRRRFKRLLPASLVCLFGVVFLFAPLVASAPQIDGLSGDIGSSLAYVANWHFILSNQSYADLFAAPSPVLHFWSLAIEEQFYLLFPLFLAILLARLGRRPARLSLVLGGLAIASTIEMAVLFDPENPSRVYYGTDTRAAELLIGALLAVGLHHRAALSDAARRTMSTSGAIALSIVVVLWVTAAQGDSWLYRGGFAGYAVLSAVVVVASMQPGRTRTLLSWGPLRWLGRVSYAVYLFHWPVFLWLTPARTQLSEWPLFALRLSVTFALAQLSLVAVERPIRHRPQVNWKLALVAPISMALLVVGTIQVSGSVSSTERIRIDDPIAALAGPMTTTTATATAPQTATADEIGGPPALPPLLPHATDEDLHVLFEGDSAMSTLGGYILDQVEQPGLKGWGDDTGRFTALNGAIPGCGISRTGWMRYRGKESPVRDCVDWAQRFVADMEDHRPTGDAFERLLVVVLAASWDVVDRQFYGDDRWRSFGDPVYEAYYASEVAKAMDLLSSRGAIVVWMAHPTNRGGIAEGLDPESLPENDPSRMRRMNEIIAEVAATRPRVRVFDLESYLRDRPGGGLEDAARPDGVHWTEGAADDIARSLGPTLIELYDQTWDEIQSSDG